MSKKKKDFYKKKGSVIKDLASKILKFLNKNSQKSFNYKQIAAAIDILDGTGKQQIIKKLEELKRIERIEETDRGQYKIIQNEHYRIGTLDVTSNKNA